MSSLMDDSIEDEIVDDESKEIYGIRDGTLFLIDATPPMFEMDKEGVSHFLKCIKQYKEILGQKLVWNRQDWMGLILFGTEKWDTDPEAKNILTVQKLNPITKDNMKQILEIEQRKWKDYKDISSPTSYPLHDVLWHAAQTFSSIKMTMSKRTVILFTCQDNPPNTDKTEKHRIRVRATSYSDIGLELFVVGLGENWNHDFYKDIEMLSRRIDDEDYERTSLEDLVEQVKLPSRVMAKLPFHLGENVTLDVHIRRFCVKREYLKTASMSKETNIPLITHSYLRKVDATNEEDDEGSERASSPVLEMEIQKYQEFANRKIYFTPAEVKSLSALHEPGIKLLCVKPIFYDPIYHFEAPYLVTYKESHRKDNKLLFSALLDKCYSKGLMVICAVTIRRQSPTNLYSMIPNVEKGGFYLYKIPFRENVRDLSKHFTDYIFDDDNMPPTSPEEVKLLEKIIKKLRIKYNPDLFPNPKLQRQLQVVESLALDLEQSEAPMDHTLPLTETMHETVGSLLKQYDDVFNAQEDVEATAKKKVKRTNGTPIDPSDLKNEETIRELVKQNKIETCTVVQLKNILKTLCLKTAGTKDELIKKIREHCAQVS